MSAPEFGTGDAALRRREQAVADVGHTLREAADAAVTASRPDAFGVLCGFFPTVLDPVAQQARDAIARGARTCDDTVRDLRSAAAAFTATDDAGAGRFGR